MYLYRRLLPATIIPNWSHGTYVICAKLAQAFPGRLRILGICHAYEDHYFHTLCSYEPIIHRFIAVSEECGARLRELLPWRAEDVVVRPYAVDAPAGLRRPPRPAGEPLQLLYAGRIEETQKRVSDLAVLAGELARLGVNFRLRVVGEGGSKPLLEARVRALGEEARGRVSIEPGVSPEQVAGLMRWADVCVLVSAYEGTSVFMLEGMAQGCVPVVTRVSGTAAVVRDGVNGYTVPVGDLAAMAGLLERLADDGALLARLSAQAHATAQRYSYAGYVAWFEELLTNVWSEPPRPWPAWTSSFPWSYAGLLRLTEEASGDVPGSWLASQILRRLRRRPEALVKQPREESVGASFR